MRWAFGEASKFNNFDRVILGNECSQTSLCVTFAETNRHLLWFKKMQLAMETLESYLVYARKGWKLSSGKRKLDLCQELWRRLRCI